MDDLSYDVQIWQTETYAGKKGNTYNVVWRVARKRFKKAFKTAALADSFRSELVSASRRGEAFDRAVGLPHVHGPGRTCDDVVDFACAYVDMKWTRAAGKSRAGNADSLATVTPALLATSRGRPAPDVMRRALTGWAFNTKRRSTPLPPEIESALLWLRANTLQVSELANPAVTRRALELLTLKLDGSLAAAKTVTRKRAVFYNALEYAVELRLLNKNPLTDVKWKAPKAVRSIDPRTVINPDQARQLLDAVGRQGPSGPRLVAFFGVMYYAALRPEEAAMLRRADLLIPQDGWGELLLSETAPTVGAAWTDSGDRRDRRQLKQRGVGDVRRVPCPPPLTVLLQEHLKRFGHGPDGRLFRNLTGGDIAESTTGRVWDKARRAAFSSVGYASPLARRPYDLRHAAVSTWLAAGVSSTQCAEWAGHSVAVLHQVYAKVLDGQQDHARERIAVALGLGD